MTSVALDETPTPFDRAALADLLSIQHGVVSRRQLRELGGRDWDVRRLVRRRELVVVHPGVYVEHTGPLTPDQRCWVAVLACWPAALTGESALPGHRDDAVVHVAIAHGRTVRPPPGVRVHRTNDLAQRVRWNLSPPAVRIEEAALDVAASRVDLLARFEVLAELCRQRHTMPARLAQCLAARTRFPDRGTLLELLADLEAGACSVLEREYLHLERSHGLPRGERQRPTAGLGRRAYQDVDYLDQHLVVELDGRAFHAGHRQWDDDHERDLDTAVGTDRLTVRLTYGQVIRHGCRTAGKIGALLQRRGWACRPVRCRRCGA